MTNELFAKCRALNCFYNVPHPALRADLSRRNRERLLGSLLYQPLPKTGEVAKLRAVRPEGERVRDLQRNSSVSHANYTAELMVEAKKRVRIPETDLTAAQFSPINQTQLPEG